MLATMNRTENENSVKVVIGSWGSYNACNGRALGSAWLDFADFNSWDEIAEELKKEGFRLDGIDAELFIQDIDGLGATPFNCDYMNPEQLYNVLSDSGVLKDAYSFKKMLAYFEVRGWDDFAELVDKYGEYWGDDVIFYDGATLEDVAQQQVDETLAELENSGAGDCWLLQYIDVKAIARDLSFGSYWEVSDGVIEILE